MSLIEGIGDEVLQCAIAVVITLVILLAWWSTGYSTNNERFRTVVIMERNVRRLYSLMPRISGNVHGNGVTVYHWTTNTMQPTQEADSSAEPSTSALTSTSSLESQASEDVQTDTESVADASPDDGAEVNEIVHSEEFVPGGSPQSISPQEIEMNRIVDAMESVTDVRNRRLAFFECQPVQQSPEQPTQENEGKSHQEASTSSLDIADEMKKNNTLKSDDNKNDKGDMGAKPDNIRIRLKYLNDDQKLVEGSLHEPLGEFKRRHFCGEMSARKLVRLIFNGQVLQREAATLASCGLFDNCVVHCLIHQPRTPNQFAQVQQQLNPQITTAESAAPNNNGHGSPNVHTQTQTQGLSDGGEREERDWDLSHILLTILASMLSIAWYFHIRFSNLFGVAANVAMIGLTALYVFAVICVYYPESGNGEQLPLRTPNATREQPPVAAASTATN